MTILENKNVLIIREYLYSLNDENVNVNMNEQNLTRCYNFITSKAYKEAIDGAAMITNEVVFGWARHFFDESMFNDSKWDKSNLKKDVSIENQIKEVKPKDAKLKKAKEKEYEEITIFDL